METTVNESQSTQADILNLISSDATAVSDIGLKLMEICRSQIDMLLGCSYIWFLLGEPLHGRRLSLTNNRPFRLVGFCNSASHLSSSLPHYQVRVQDLWETADGQWWENLTHARGNPSNLNDQDDGCWKILVQPHQGCQGPRVHKADPSKTPRLYICFALVRRHLTVHQKQLNLTSVPWRQQ